MGKKSEIDPFLEKHSLSPLDPEKIQEDDGPPSMLGYKLALCLKKDPRCVRYHEYGVLRRKILHIICPLAKEGCETSLPHPELEQEPDCEQEGVRGVFVSAEIQVPEIIKKFSSDVIKKVSGEYVQKCNRLIKKLPFRKRL